MAKFQIIWTFRHNLMTIKNIKMTANIFTIFMAFLFLSYTKPHYPNIIVSINITDKETKKIAEGAEYTIMTTYETKKCLPWMVEPFEEYSDTFKIKITNRVFIYSLRNFPKKYEIKVTHEAYKTVIKRDSFTTCNTSTLIDIELEKK
jgi:hypothetical protein